MGIAPARTPVSNEPFLPALENLPPFPAVALKALNVLAGTETSLRELCDVIRPDPVFSAEILRVANSPLVAFSKEVTSMLQASMLLGFRRLRRLVIMVGLRSYVDCISSQLLRSCWRHSVACALIAERTAGPTAVDRDAAYTGGILHDVGRVVLATLQPESYAALLAQPLGDAAEVLRSEQQAFGLDHCQAGGQLAVCWHLPGEVKAIIAQHHDPLTHAQDAPELNRLSCRLADALGYATSPHGPSFYTNAVLAEFPDGMRARIPNANDLTRDIDRELRVIEAR
jgi:putative nucleotidyltransferase with HDIG domain